MKKMKYNLDKVNIKDDLKQEVSSKIFNIYTAPAIKDIKLRLYGTDKKVKMSTLEPLVSNERRLAAILLFYLSSVEVRARLSLIRVTENTKCLTKKDIYSVLSNKEKVDRELNTSILSKVKTYDLVKETTFGNVITLLRTVENEKLMMNFASTFPWVHPKARCHIMTNLKAIRALRNVVMHNHSLHYRQFISMPNVNKKYAKLVLMNHENNNYFGSMLLAFKMILHPDVFVDFVNELKPFICNEAKKSYNLRDNWADVII